MSSFVKALASGYSADQILNFLSNAHPSLKPRISQAKKMGYSPKGIVNFLSNLFSSGEPGRGGSEAFQSKLSGERAEERLKDIASLGVGVAGLAAASKLAPKVMQSVRGGQVPPPAPPGNVPAPTANVPAPAVGPQPMANAPVSPPAIPQAPAPNLAAAAQAQQPNVSPTVQPDQVVGAGKPIAPSILDEIGASQRTVEMAQKGFPPEVIANNLLKEFTPEQRKAWHKHSIREKKSLPQVVKEHITGPEGFLKENVFPLQKDNENILPSKEDVQERIKKIETLKDDAHWYRVTYNEEKDPIEKQELKKEFDKIQAEINENYKDIPSAEKYIKSKYPQSILSIKEGGDYISLDYFSIPEQQRGKGIGTAILNDLSEYAQKYDKKIFSIPSDERNKRLFERSGFEKIKKGDPHNIIGTHVKNPSSSQKEEIAKQKPLVATPDGIVGEIKHSRGQESLIESDGKLHKAKTEDLIESPLAEKDTADLLDELNESIEKETGEQVSRSVRLVAYVPEKNLALFIPWGGQPYLYDDLTEEDQKFLQEHTQKRRTTGESLIGVWTEGTKSPMGSKMSDWIRKLQKERGGKGNEYAAKFQMVYDPHGHAIEEKKRKLKESKRKK